MTEIKIQIEAPGLEAAIQHLADALIGHAGETEEVATPTSIKKRSASRKTTKAESTEDPAETPTKTQAPPVAIPGEVEVATVTPAKKQIAIPDLIAAGAKLLDAGKMDDLLALLQKLGVPAIQMLRPDQIEPCAEGLRALGADL